MTREQFAAMLATLEAERRALNALVVVLVPDREPLEVGGVLLTLGEALAVDVRSLDARELIRC